MNQIRFAAAIASLVIGGCTTTTFHGDAALVRCADFPFETLDILKLPEFTLSQQTYRWEVRDLPVSVFPSELIVIRQPDSLGWLEAVVNVKCILSDGTAAVNRTVRLSDWGGGGSRVDGETRVSFLLRDSPNWGSWLNEFDAVSYDVIIDVIQPSSRPSDRARLEGLTDVELVRQMGG